MIGHSPPTFADDVAAAAARPDVVAAVRAVYAAVQTAVDARRPACDASGRCCHFDAYGHDLFVTTLEVAAFVRDLPADAVATDIDPGGCPFQVGRLCGVHAVRPFGCRMFYCDPSADDWQRAQYEWFHAEIAALHERFAVPYAYVEWRRALAAVRLPPGSPVAAEAATPVGRFRLRTVG